LNDEIKLNIFRHGDHYAHRMLKTWTTMSNEIHKDHKDLLIAKVDCRSEKFSLFCRQYKVSHFPTLAWFKNGKIEETYASHKISVESLKTFVSEMLNGHHYSSKINPPQNHHVNNVNAHKIPAPHKIPIHKDSDVSSHYEVITKPQKKIRYHHPEHQQHRPIHDANDAEEKTIEHSSESHKKHHQAKRPNFDHESILHKNKEHNNVGVLNHPRFIHHPLQHDSNNTSHNFMMSSKKSSILNSLKRLKDKFFGTDHQPEFQLHQSVDRNINMDEMMQHNEVHKNAHIMQMGYDNFKSMLDPHGITFVIFYGNGTTAKIHKHEIQALKKGARKYMKNEHALGEVNCGLKLNAELCVREKFIQDPMVNVYNHGKLSIHNLALSDHLGEKEIFKSSFTLT
jgi:hypothetical protein